MICFAEKTSSTEYLKARNNYKIIYHYEWETLVQNERSLISLAYRVSSAMAHPEKTKGNSPCIFDQQSLKTLKQRPLGWRYELLQ